MTLHDMWAFTGHCAYSYDCDRWKTGCGRCPYPQTEPAVRRDSTSWEWKLKRWVYDHANLQIVAPSRWLTDLAKQSLLNRFPIHRIPYGIDTEGYQPLDLDYCRTALGIPRNQKVLMFAAARLNDSRKGFDLLIQALNQLPSQLKQETVLLVIGDNGEAIAKTVGMTVINLGFVQHDRLKAIAYSAADLFIFPTRADNLPLVLQESMACGTPIVSFKVGGVGDLVRPGLTGYLAESGNAEDFCRGIVQLLEDQVLLQQMRQQCRAIALEEFELATQTQQYIDVYRKALEV
jgi:glycosyltransferase involved in cell wall biosynthesis